MNLQEYKKYLEEQKPKRVNKFKNKIVEYNGIKFRSELECDYYQKLEFAVKSGELIRFEHQVKFEVCRGINYYLDFIEYWRDLTVRYIDTKGFSTPLFKLKKAIVEDKYGIKIELVKKA